MHTKHIIIKDIPLSYYINDLHEDRNNLIFLHGWGSNSTLWFKAFDQEFLNNNNIYCIDLPGFGNTPSSINDLDVSGFGEFILEFIDKLGLKNITLIGHSLGGRITIKLAAIYPEKFNNIVLVDSAGIYHTSQTTKAITKLSHIVKPIFKIKALHGLREKIYKLLKADDYLNSPHLQKTFVNVVQEDLTQFLERIKIPTLIIWGEKDENEYTPLSDGEKMNKLIKESILIVLEDGSHYSFLDKPIEFIEALNQFLKKNNG